MEIIRVVFTAPDPFSAPFPKVIFHLIGYSDTEALELMGNKYAGFASTMNQTFRDQVDSILCEPSVVGIIEVNPSHPFCSFVHAVEFF